MRAYATVIAILALIFGGIGLSLWSKFSAMSAAGFQPPPVTIVATRAKLEVRDRYVHAVGSLQARRGIDVSSESSGQVTQINFESGDVVEKDQLLVVLNDEVEKAARASQTAALRLAELQFERDSQLLRNKSISQTRFDQSRTVLDQARAELAETEARLANKTIRAPFAGTMGIREIALGDYISPGTLIASLQDLSELQLDFSVPVNNVPLIQVGQAISFNVSAYPGRDFNGEIIAFNSKIDSSTRNLKIRAHVENQQGLFPGMFAEVRINVGKAQEFVTVPESTIAYSLQGDIIYIVDEQADPVVAQSRIVVPGEIRDGHIAILSGLEANTLVVSAGQNKLYPGAHITLSGEAGQETPAASQEQ